MLQLAVVIGVATQIEGLKKFCNSALVMDSGKIVYTYHKQLIPSYSVFDETRHFIAGENNQLTFVFKGNIIALLICEDIWYDNHQGYRCNPVAQLADEVDQVGDAEDHVGRRAVLHALAIDVNVRRPAVKRYIHKRNRL